MVAAFFRGIAMTLGALVALVLAAVALLFLFVVALV